MTTLKRQFCFFHTEWRAWAMVLLLRNKTYVILNGAQRSEESQSGTEETFAALLRKFTLVILNGAQRSERYYQKLWIDTTMKAAYPWGE